jgi:ABC-type branched-subunit amino acid transport system ATPase component
MTRAGDGVPTNEAGPGPALLEVTDVCARHGHLRVLTSVSVRVDHGTSVALLGTNGAGKSTLLRVVAGLHPPTSGAVVFDGTDVTGLSADARARRGLVLVEGGRATFPGLSVVENLRLGAYPLLRRNRAEAARRLDAALEHFPALRPLLPRTAGSLSGGEQQMTALAKALMADPRLLMIDELSLGLAPIVLEQLVHVVERLVADGVTVLLVEQSLNVACALADRAYFLEKGEVRFTGPTADLLDRGDLARSVFFGLPAAG